MRTSLTTEGNISATRNVWYLTPALTADRVTLDAYALEWTELVQVLSYLLVICSVQWCYALGRAESEQGLFNILLGKFLLCKHHSLIPSFQLLCRILPRRQPAVPCDALRQLGVLPGRRVRGQRAARLRHRRLRRRRHGGDVLHERHRGSPVRPRLKHNLMRLLHTLLFF